jgi:hypothetical protein
MNLVDEEDGVLLEIGQHSGQISGPLDHRSCGGANGYAHFVSDDVGEGGLS